MEIAREDTESNIIRAWEPGRLRIGEQWLHGHLIISVDQIISTWSPETPESMDAAGLEPAIAFQPEIILLGTGPDITLPNVELMAELATRGIGLETMNTPAACRTFNLLLNEGRRVVAALFNPMPTDPA